MAEHAKGLLGWINSADMAYQTSLMPMYTFTIEFEGVDTEVSIEGKQTIRDLLEQANSECKAPRIASIYVLRSNGENLNDEQVQIYESDLCTGQRLQLAEFMSKTTT